MSSVVILIIIHKPDPSQTELASLRQCEKILGKHPIVLVCPEGLNINEYSKAAPKIRFDFIDPKWQSSYAMFNRLKIEPFLYRRYSKYKYILFYELDAWVFRDEIDYWCNQGYDYIGAPWFEGFHEATSNSRFIGIGNGGFSLRKVKSHLKALHSCAYISPAKTVIHGFLLNISFASFVTLIKRLTISNNVYYRLNQYDWNEDKFWGNVVAKRFKWYKVPDMQTASRFSMEKNASLLYERNNYKLPMGCHAWERFEPEFWNQFIEKSDKCEN